MRKLLTFVASLLTIGVLQGVQAYALTGLDGNHDWLVIVQQDLHSIDLYERDGPSVTFVRSFGGAESNPATEVSFDLPSDAALTSGGRFWVADSGHKRVLLLDHEGRLVREVTAGSQGPLGEPTGLALSDNGELYVADATHDTIEVIAADGDPLRQLALQQGVTAPHGLALSRDGTVVYAIGRAGAQVHGYNVQTGRLLHRYQPELNDNAHHPTVLNPAAIDVDPSSGEVVVVDESLTAVLRFTRELELISSFGHTHGAGPTGMYNPQGVFVDDEGQIWVIDYGNHRGQQYSPGGVHIGTFADEQIGYVTAPYAGQGDGQRSGRMSSTITLVFVAVGVVTALCLTGAAGRLITRKVL